MKDIYKVAKRCWYCGGLNLPDARKCEHCGGGEFEEETPQNILDSKSFYNLVTEGGTYEPQSPILKEPVDYSAYRPGQSAREFIEKMKDGVIKGPPEPTVLSYY